MIGFGVALEEIPQPVQGPKTPILFFGRFSCKKINPIFIFQTSGDSNNSPDLSNVDGKDPPRDENPADPSNPLHVRTKLCLVHGLPSKRPYWLFAKLAGTAEYWHNLPLVHTSYCAIYSLLDAERSQGF